MCLGIPMKIVELNGRIGMAESSGIKRQVVLDLIEDPKVGDYVLIHAGFAIQKLDEKEAIETLGFLKEVLLAGEEK